MNTDYMYMKGWYYMYKERSWPLVNKLSLGQRRDPLVPLGRILVVITVCIRVHDIVDLERDHVNPAVRAVGKSEVEIEIVY